MFEVREVLLGVALVFIIAGLSCVTTVINKVAHALRCIESRLGMIERSATYLRYLKNEDENWINKP
jgi:hypothetical protein